MTTPTSSTPAAETPAGRAMSASAQTAGTPAGHALTACAPIAETPASRVLTASTPTSHGPSARIPVAQTPTRRAPRARDLAGNVPVARRPSAPALSAGLVLLVLALIVASLLVGKITLSWSVLSNQNPVARIIFLELRLPRALLGALIGAALGLAGAAMQSYLRNPLAEPGTLGVSSMSALGAVLSIFFGIAGTHPWTLPLCGVAGGVAAMTALFALAGRSASMLTLVLSGIILGALGIAGISLVLSLSPSPWAASEIIRWMLGALTDRSFDDLTIAAPLIIIGGALVLMCREPLNALTLGEEGARSLGIDLSRVRWMMCMGMGLLVGASVAVTGIIGFVGLVVPHLLRPLVGARPSALLVPSAFGGAALVLAGDVIVRILPGGSELQLGVVMSLVGAPFFFVLLYSMRRRAV
jgi:iron complex transport system permease protein